LIPIAKPIIDEETISLVASSIKSGKLAQGESVLAFEEAFARYVDTNYAIAVNSGTAALHIALLAAGVKVGDEVITTPFSFIASANSILYCGARPVFVDINTSDFNIDADLIEKKITQYTKAIVGVHLYGQSYNIEKIQELCRRHNLTMIEDACQAHGAEYKGKRVGSFGIGCFSFYPTKNMTTGEGGIITTDDPEIFEKSCLLRSHGQKQRYLHTSLGYNFRMTEMAAVIGIQQLKKLDAFNSKRIANASVLTKAINDIKGLSAPEVFADKKHVYHQYTIRVTSAYPLTRDELKKKLEEKGVGCAVHYPIPIHRQPYYQSLGFSDYLPIAEKASNEVLSLPVHPSLTDQDLNYIKEVLNDVG
jgi:dTDP-4-amino-4,6-dideoxygalactose transaminase